jgi:hypothetical protein
MSTDSIGQIRCLYSVVEYGVELHVVDCNRSKLCTGDRYTSGRQVMQLSICAVAAIAFNNSRLREMALYHLAAIDESNSKRFQDVLLGLPIYFDNTA